MPSPMEGCRFSAQSTDFLGEAVGVVLDRPMGSRHPSRGFEYTFNYVYRLGDRE